MTHHPLVFEMFWPWPWPQDLLALTNSSDRRHRGYDSCLEIIRAVLCCIVY